jgi:hypothetical protein
MKLRERAVWLSTWLVMPLLVVFVLFGLVFGTLYIWWREDVRFRRAARVRDVHAP